MTCKSGFVVVKQAERQICKGRMAEGAFHFNRDKSKRRPKPFNQPLRLCSNLEIVSCVCPAVLLRL